MARARDNGEGEGATATTARQQAGGDDRADGIGDAGAVAAGDHPANGDAEVAPAADPVVDELGGPSGPEPTRFGDWERKGRCIDF